MTAENFTLTLSTHAARYAGHCQVLLQPDRDNLNLNALSERLGAPTPTDTHMFVGYPHEVLDGLLVAPYNVGRTLVAGEPTPQPTPRQPQIGDIILDAPTAEPNEAYFTTAVGRALLERRRAEKSDRMKRAGVIAFVISGVAFVGIGGALKDNTPPAFEPISAAVILSELALMGYGANRSNQIPDKKLPDMSGFAPPIRVNSMYRPGD